MWRVWGRGGLNRGGCRSEDAFGWKGREKNAPCAPRGAKEIDLTPFGAVSQLVRAPKIIIIIIKKTKKPTNNNPPLKMKPLDRRCCTRSPLLTAWTNRRRILNLLPLIIHTQHPTRTALQEEIFFFFAVQIYKLHNWASAKLLRV